MERGHAPPRRRSRERAATFPSRAFPGRVLDDAGRPRTVGSRASRSASRAPEGRTECKEPMLNRQSSGRLGLV